MKSISEIIERVDHCISIVPGSAILSDEEWQTLKSAVLAAQTTSKQSTPLEVTHGACRECGKDTYNLVLLCENCE